MLVTSRRLRFSPGDRWRLAPLAILALALAGCSGGPSTNGSGDALPEAMTEPGPAPAEPDRGAAEPDAGSELDADGSDGQDVPVPPAGASDPDEPVRCSAPDAAVRERALTLINAARATARQCGTERYEAAAAVRWNDRLQAAAEAHSADMATHNFFDHTGSDGGGIGQRVTDAGYRWRRVGENIAAGQRSVAVAVDGWVASPGHCRNLMNPGFTEIAVACVEDAGARYTRYWTNVLASDR